MQPQLMVLTPKPLPGCTYGYSYQINAVWKQNTRFIPLFGLSQISVSPKALVSGGVMTSHASISNLLQLRALAAQLRYHVRPLLRPTSLRAAVAPVLNCLTCPVHFR